MGGIHALALADWRRDGAFSEALPGNERSMAEFDPLIKQDSLSGNALQKRAVAMFNNENLSTDSAEEP